MVAHKLIVVELNEVPFKVVDDFRARHPDSALAEFLGSSDQYVTLTEDEIQLTHGSAGRHCIAVFRTRNTKFFISGSRPRTPIANIRRYGVF